jgi:hypothetical protein
LSRKKSTEVINIDDDNDVRSNLADAAFINVVGDPTATSTPMAPSRRKSNDSASMSIDDDGPSSPTNEESIMSQSSSKRLLAEQTVTYLTTEEFKYTMDLLDSKINAIYKVCRFISDQQQENTKSLAKLVALDELSDNFWKVSYLIYINRFTLI